MNIDGSSSSRSMKTPLKEFNGSSSSSLSSPLRGIPFRKLSGCYECRMVVDPVLGFTRDPSLRATICSCPQCGEIFMKPENLELHQTVRHAGTLIILWWWFIDLCCLTFSHNSYSSNFKPHLYFFKHFSEIHTLCCCYIQYFSILAVCIGTFYIYLNKQLQNACSIWPSLFLNIVISTSYLHTFQFPIWLCHHGSPEFNINHF